VVNICKIPKLVDNKRKHMEKGLSQAQRDHLLLKQGKDDAAMKQQMVDAFDRSNQTLHNSISRMTNCLSSLGEGIASGMQMLAMALAGPQQHVRAPYPPHPYQPNFNGMPTIPIFPNHYQPRQPQPYPHPGNESPRNAHQFLGDQEENDLHSL
jgi:hypothetical protein